jgi:uncharacterized protein (DUF2252 family)
VIPSSSSLRERMAFGQKQRQILKRSDQANWGTKKRKDAPIEIIRTTNRERIPELVPIKMARMAVTPFGFFRGSVAVMAADLAATPSTGMILQVRG